MENTQLTIRITKERKHELKKIAKANGMTLSQLFRNLISQIN
jgi:antitoxin component of RelBE/YafQ-DinJ toxin-antitoxin module